MNSPQNQVFAQRGASRTKSQLHSRREFLGEIGRGMMVATIGYSLATELGLATAVAADAPEALAFGELESLVCLMQETPATKLLPLLAEKLKSGTELKRLVAAGALANARTFGGEDYVGFHTMMALSPSLHLARELPAAQQPLPVFKVLNRNTNRMQEQVECGHGLLGPAPVSAPAR